MSNPQLELAFETRPWGGRREGAGRKPIKGRHDADHRRRPEVVPSVPLHVVLRTVASVPRLRQQKTYDAIRRALALTMNRGGSFRVVHISIQHNHLHLIVEAGLRDVLTKGMQALAIIAARAINRACGRKGKVFAYRYHATPITSRRQMRNTLAYVLNNWRRHDEDRRNVRTARAVVDPYSTGIWFGGWAGMEDQFFPIPPSFIPLPAANATCWLLTTGWKAHGLIGVRERPGPLRS